MRERLSETQAFHRTFAREEALINILELFPEYTRLNARSNEYEYSAALTKKGKLLTNRRKLSDPGEIISPLQNGHDRVKKYIIAEGDIVPPLIDMGVMTRDGSIVKRMHDKYRQINRFLEMVGDMDYSGHENLTILDFGCGKSYLTFILYHFFAEIKKIPVSITGVDLKEDVIAECTALAEKYGYKNLSFAAGDIDDFRDGAPVDMVVSLHACDTATDRAIYAAVRRGAKYIFAAPCCQHEINSQIGGGALPLLTRHGAIRQRAASLLTDAIRGNCLTALGYRTQIMEFVDLCHTPKNLLIRAIKTRVPETERTRALNEITEACGTLGVRPRLCELLGFI